MPKLACNLTPRELLAQIALRGHVDALRMALDSGYVTAADAMVVSARSAEMLALAVSRASEAELRAHLAGPDAHLKHVSATVRARLARLAAERLLAEGTGPA
jgi:hypothetical protein